MSGRATPTGGSDRARTGVLARSGPPGARTPPAARLPGIDACPSMRAPIRATNRIARCVRQGETRQTVGTVPRPEPGPLERDISHPKDEAHMAGPLTGSARSSPRNVSLISGRIWSMGVRPDARDHHIRNHGAPRGSWDGNDIDLILSIMELPEGINRKHGQNPKEKEDLAKLPWPGFPCSNWRLMD